MVVDARIVQKQYDTWAVEGATISETLENFLNEVLEYGGVYSALNQLSAYNGVLCYSCN